MDKLISFIKLKSSTIVAWTIYLITCICLYLVQYKFYGGAIDTQLIFIAIYPILFSIGWSIRDRKTETTKKTKLYKNIFYVFRIVIDISLIFYIIYLLWSNPYELCMYYCIAILVVLMFIFVKDNTNPESNKNMSPLILMKISYIAILVITLIYLLILKPCTVKSGKTVLKEEGYNNITFVDNYKGTAYVFKDNVKELKNNEEKLGFYFYEADKQNNKYGVLVSVVSGRIIDFDYVDNYSLLFLKI